MEERSFDNYFPLPFEYNEMGKQIGARDENDSYIMVADIRGWGHLTGQGSYDLDQDTAREIQDDLGKYLVSCANNMPLAISTIETLMKLLKPHFDNEITYSPALKIHNNVDHIIAKLKGDVE